MFAILSSLMTRARARRTRAIKGRRARRSQQRIAIESLSSLRTLLQSPPQRRASPKPMSRCRMGARQALEIPPAILGAARDAPCSMGRFWKSAPFATPNDREDQAHQSRRKRLHLQPCHRSTRTVHGIVSLAHSSTGPNCSAARSAGLSGLGTRVKDGIAIFAINSGTSTLIGCAGIVVQSRGEDKTDILTNLMTFHDSGNLNDQVSLV